MGAGIPKQFLMVKEKPLLYHTMRVFLETYPDLELILVLPIDHMHMAEEIIDAYFDKDRIRITAGGDTRFQSVKNGLTLVAEESIVFVHDGVRCLVTPSLLKRTYEKALETGTAIPAINAPDSVRLLSEDGSQVLDRNKVRLIQTPQTFHSKVLLPAFQIDYKDKFTDEATVVEAFGLKVSIVEGEDTNLKITRPIDLVMAEAIIGIRIKEEMGRKLGIE